MACIPELDRCSPGLEGAQRTSFKYRKAKWEKVLRGMERRRLFAPQEAVLPTAVQSRAAQGTPAARLLFWNGTLLVALGANACPTPESQLLRCSPSASGALYKGQRARAGTLVFAFPHAVEAVHPHRKGEADIQESIKICGTVLMGVGALYSCVGGQNLQARACLSATAKPAPLCRCRSDPQEPTAAHGAPPCAGIHVRPAHAPSRGGAPAGLLRALWQDFRHGAFRAAQRGHRGRGRSAGAPPARSAARACWQEPVTAGSEPSGLFLASVGKAPSALREAPAPKPRARPERPTLNHPRPGPT